MSKTELQDMKSFRQQICDWKVGQREVIKRSGVASDERNILCSERIKQV